MRPKSKKPGKQRLYEYSAPKNDSHKMVSAPLSKKLREEKGVRSLPIREGDTVLIVRGDHKGKNGKVNKTDPQKQRIYIEGLSSKKTDAQEIAIPVHPSNVVIQKYNSRDRRHLNILNRRIADEEKKIDIESVLAEAEAEEAEDLIEFDDDELEGMDDELLEEDLEDLEDEFALVNEDEELEEDDELDEDVEEDDEDEKEDEQ